MCIFVGNRTQIHTIMYKDNQFYIAHGPKGAICINGKMANRHGLIAGATGTGKTVSLQVIAESFCNAGVPCFMADMKGDLSGISLPGKVSGFIEKRMPDWKKLIYNLKDVRLGSMMSLENKDIPCAHACPIWDHYYSLGY